MQKQIHRTPLGEIHYWISRSGKDSPWLVFLPGLTADHRLFDKQTEYFESRCNCFMWDAPAHGASRPFRLEFLMDDLTGWLHEMLQREGVEQPVLVGQSMGGYIAQAYSRRYSDAAGLVSVDSAPLSRSYYAGWELALLKHAYWVYRPIPWKLLLKWGSTGTARSLYGRELMARMMEGYGAKEYCQLAAHGYRLLSLAVEAHGDWEPECPVLLLCGEKDGAGSSRRYNRKWAGRKGYRLVWLEGAGHNSNTDVPERVNRLVEEFVGGLV